MISLPYIALAASTSSISFDCTASSKGADQAVDAQDEDEDLKDDSEDSVADADLVNLVPLNS